MSAEEGDFPAPTLLRINTCISLTSSTFCFSASVAARRDRTREGSCIDAFRTCHGEPGGGSSRYSIRAVSWSSLSVLSYCGPNSSRIFSGVSWPVRIRRCRGRLETVSANYPVSNMGLVWEGEAHAVPRRFGWPSRRSELIKARASGSVDAFVL